MRVCVSCDQFVDVGSTRCPKCSTRLLSLDEFRMPDLASPKEGRSLLDARIGTVLGGEWVVDGILGEGGEGVVYRVHNRKSGVSAAAKRQRSAVEQRIDGPNVLAQVGSAAGADGRRFALFEHCPAGSLRGLLDRMLAAGERPTPAQVVESLRQITRGLLVYHGRGLVHGDVKPDNVLVATGDDGSVQLKLGDPLAAEDLGKSRGSPPYAAPEVCDGVPANAKSDLWALGVIAYELITGKLPFDATGREGMVQQVVSDKVVPPPLPRTTKSRLVKLVRSLLAKDPALRPGSPREVLATLDLIDADPEEWQRLGSVGLAAVGAVVLALALVLGGGGGGGGGGEPSKPKQQEPVVAKTEPPSVQPVVPQKPLSEPTPTEVVKPVIPKPVESEGFKLQPLRVSLLKGGDLKVGKGKTSVLYVEEGRPLELQLGIFQEELSAPLLVERSQYRAKGQQQWVPGDRDTVSIPEMDLPRPGESARQFECECVTAKATQVVEPLWVEVIVYAKAPTAYADGEWIKADAQGYTHWAIGDVEAGIGRPIRHTCEPWSLPSVTFSIQGDGSDRKLNKEVVVRWKGEARAKVVELDDGWATMKVQCSDGCEFLLEDVGSAGKAPAAPVPLSAIVEDKDRGLHAVNLRKVLRDGWKRGTGRFRLAVRKDGKDVALRFSNPKWDSIQRDFSPDPFRLFTVSELVSWSNPGYRIHPPLGEMATAARKVQVRAECKTDMDLNRRLGVEVLGKGWEWDAKRSELYGVAGQSGVEQVKFRLQLGGFVSQEGSVSMTVPYTATPFEHLARLADSARELPGDLAQADLQKSSIFSSVLRFFGFQGEGDSDDPWPSVRKSRYDWVEQMRILGARERLGALSPVKVGDVEEIRVWFGEHRSALAGLGDKLIRLKSITKEDLKLLMESQMAHDPKSTKLVDVVEDYVSVLGWAAAHSAECSAPGGPSMVVGAATLADCLRMETLPQFGSIDSLIVPVPRFDMASIKVKSVEGPHAISFDRFLSDGAWSNSGNGNDHVLRLVRMGQTPSRLSAADSNTAGIPLHFLVTFVRQTR